MTDFSNSAINFTTGEFYPVDIKTEFEEKPGPITFSGDTSFVLSEANSGSDTDSSVHPPPVKRRHLMQLCDSWLTNPFLASWLGKSDKIPYGAECLVCGIPLRGGKNDLLRHSHTKRHTECMVLAGMQFSECMSSHSGSETSGIEDRNSIKKTEIRYVLDIVNHGRSFYAHKQYFPIIQAAHADCECESLRKMRLKRTKIKAIIKNVLDKTIIETRTRILKKKYFSVLIKESTDLSALCVLARYTHEGKIETYLLEYVNIRNADAESLYKYFEFALEKYQLSMKNVIGISIDTASVTLKKKKSFVSLLLKSNPNIAVFPCICHNIQLLASDACEHLPKNLAKLMYKVYTYFSRSLKRQQRLREIQTEMNLAMQEMLEPSKTKWLAVSECVDRILEQWDALRNYFERKVHGMYESESESDVAESSDMPRLSMISTEIMNSLRSLYTKAFLEFVQFSLNIITKFNQIFKSSEILVFNVSKYCDQFLQEIGSNFIKHTVLATAENLSEIDPFKVENLLPPESIYIGGKAQRTIEEIKAMTTDNKEQSRLTKFYERCQKFYQTAYRGAVKRLPINDAFLKALEFLDPSVALDIEKHTNQLDCLITKFGEKFDWTIIRDEWHALGFLTIRDKVLKEQLMGLGIHAFWQEIYNMSDIGAKRRFENIYNLAMTCLSLPHSNADTERFFSMVSEIKTAGRDRLKSDTIAALCRIKLEFKNTGTVCSNYIISDDYLKNFNQDMYKMEQVPKTYKNLIGQETSDSE
nr:uncharacterized protein LOC117225674 isoform X1 [Megalopta genalis]